MSQLDAWFVGCEHSTKPMPIDPAPNAVGQRKQWLAPAIAPHSTLTLLTQQPLPQPLALLFLQSSKQCFNDDGTVTTCP